MPLHKVRPQYNQIIDAVRKSLAASDLTITSTGRRHDAGNISTDTGFWEDQGSKTQRLLIHLVHDGETLKARFPKSDDEGDFANLGAPNAEIGSAAVHSTRILVMVKNEDDTFLLADDWEWLAFFIFEPPISNASTSALLKGFRPTTQKVTVRLKVGGDVDFAVREIVLVSLPNDKMVTTSVAGKPQTITYSDATTALEEFLNVGRLPSTQQVLKPTDGGDAEEVAGAKGDAE